MILPAGHEAMSDTELVDALVAADIYDREAAEEAMAIARGYAPPAD